MHHMSHRLAAHLYEVVQALPLHHLLLKPRLRLRSAPLERAGDARHRDHHRLLHLLGPASATGPGLLAPLRARTHSEGLTKNLLERRQDEVVAQRHKVRADLAEGVPATPPARSATRRSRRSRRARCPRAETQRGEAQRALDLVKLARGDAERRLQHRAALFLRHAVFHLRPHDTQRAALRAGCALSEPTHRPGAVHLLKL